eukprot:92571_1
MALKYKIVFFCNPVFNSKLLTFKEDIYFIQLLLTKISNIKRFSLLFRASEHGYTSNQFHNKCDDNGPTITIIKSHFGNIFGGYRSVSWTTPQMKTSTQDTNAFLFLVRSNDKVNQNKCPMVFKLNSNVSGCSLSCNRFCGPCFGKDLCIEDHCNMSINNRFGREIIASHVCHWVYDYGRLKGPLCGGSLTPWWDNPRFDADVKKYVPRAHFTVVDYEVYSIH